jgi:hypothetical protein
MSHHFASHSAAGKIFPGEYHSSVLMNQPVLWTQQHIEKMPVLQILVSQTDFLQMYQIPGHILLSPEVHL